MCTLFCTETSREVITIESWLTLHLLLRDLPTKENPYP